MLDSSGGRFSRRGRNSAGANARNWPGRRTGGLFLAVLLSAVFVAAVPASIQDTTANRVLGQIDLVHNTINFGGPSAILSGTSGFGTDIALGSGAAAIDSSSSVHHLYVADGGNNRVLGWYDVRTLANGAPADLVIGQSDFYFGICNDRTSSADSGGLGADSLCNPVAVATDSRGNLYVADQFNNRALEYDNPFAACAGKFPCIGSPATLVFGQGGSGKSFNIDNCTVSQTGLCEPAGIAVDATGNLFVGDMYNNRVLEYDGPFGPGQRNDVTADLVFGQGVQGTNFTANSCDGDVRNPVPSATSMCFPMGVATDSNGNLYVADRNNNRVLEFDGSFGLGQANDVTPDLVFGQGAGGKSFGSSACGEFFPNVSNGATSLCEPVAVALDSLDDVYVSDHVNNRVVEYDGRFGPGQANDVTADRVYGQGSSGNNLQANDINCVFPPSAATLCNPAGIALDATNLYVFDGGNSRVLAFDNALSNFTAPLELGQIDFVHNTPNIGGPFAASSNGVAVDRNSFPNHLYVSDALNHRVLGYRDATGFTNSAPADLVLGQSDFFASGGIGPPSPSNATAFGGPAGIAVDQHGNLFVADSSNSRVLEFSAPFTYSGATPEPASVVFGQGPGGNNFTGNVCAEGGNLPSVSATGLCDPSAVAVDRNGNLFVVDSQNNRVLEYNTPLANPTSPNVTANLVFGQGPTGTNFTSNVFVCATAQGSIPGPSETGLCQPEGVAVDASGNLYIADFFNSRVLEFDGPFGAGQINDVTADNVFGQGGGGNNFTTGICADGRVGDPPASATGMCRPIGLTIDGSGNLFVADYLNGRVLQFDGPFGHGKTNDATADRVFGQGAGGINFGRAGCNGFSSLVTTSPTGLCFPSAVDFDTAGDLFVADSGNDRLVAYDQRILGTLKISRRHLNFGAVKVGGAKSIPLEITNADKANRKIQALPIAIESVRAPDPFSVVNGCPEMLEPGASCTITVTFTPTVAMPFAATLTIVDNVIGDLQNNIILIGRGKASGRPN